MWAPCSGARHVCYLVYGKEMAKAPKNFELKNFRNRVFGSNHVLNHCKSILKYIFSENSQNFHILTIFLKL